jgi:molybdopterin converting factor small subunit
LKIVVKAYLFLQQALGLRELALDLQSGAAIDDLLHLLREEYGLPDQIKSGRQTLTLFEGDRVVDLTVLIDGLHIKTKQGTATLLHEGAVVALFPPAAGG